MATSEQEPILIRKPPVRKMASGRWQARVLIEGKYKSVGTFSTKKEAQEHASIAEQIFKSNQRN